MNYAVYENNNHVILKGKIRELPVYSHTVMGEGFFEMFIEVKRLSNEVDILPVTISERLIGDFKLGDEIGIHGQFRSYNKLEDEKSKLMLTIFVKELLNPNEMSESNQIYLIGYICKEPIYRTTPFGREICDCLLAVNRAYNKSDYLPCIAWGRNARFVRDLGVGEKLEVQGRVQSRKYQKRVDDNTFETRTAYEISLSSIMLSTEPNFAIGSGYEMLENSGVMPDITASKTASNEVV
ncbi:MAG: single-stranded DNA-binding protein [Clostridia bacterium]|nr:single-stranded DNA-binding protein [Clostridia bacterium]